VPKLPKSASVYALGTTSTGGKNTKNIFKREKWLIAIEIAITVERKRRLCYHILL